MSLQTRKSCIYLDKAEKNGLNFVIRQNFPQFRTSGSFGQRSLNIILKSEDTFEQYFHPEYINNSVPNLEVKYFK